MKVVILAAGLSTRLKSLLPKSLTPLKGEVTILDYQIDSIVKFIPIDNIYIVVGYKKEFIMERYPNLIYIYNHAYAHTNTGKSLYLALRKIQDDVIWLNGDVYFDREIFKRIVDTNISSILVNDSACCEEEVKYALDNEGYVKDISKEVPNGSGEALGINLIKRQDLNIYIKHLLSLDDKDYFEKALSQMIRIDRVKIKPIYVDELFCKEIDYPADMEIVCKHIQRKTSTDEFTEIYGTV